MGEQIRRQEAELLQLRVENAKMRQLLAGWASAANHARHKHEECPGDKHCVCVYTLRKQLDDTEENEQAAAKLLSDLTNGTDPETVKGEAALYLALRPEND